MESDPITIAFTVNGENQGVAFQIPKDDLEGEALFPHIITKNMSFDVNFGQHPNKWCNVTEKPETDRVDYVDEEEEPVEPPPREVCIQYKVTKRNKIYINLMHISTEKVSS